MGLHLSTGTSALRESLWKFLPGVTCVISFLPCDLCTDEIAQSSRARRLGCSSLGLRPTPWSCAGAGVLAGWSHRLWVRHPLPQLAAMDMVGCQPPVVPGSVFVINLPPAVVSWTAFDILIFTLAVTAILNKEGFDLQMSL